MDGVFCIWFFFFFQAEDGIRDIGVTGVQTCALPICILELTRPITTNIEKKARGRIGFRKSDKMCEECTEIGRASCRERV